MPTDAARAQPRRGHKRLRRADRPRTVGRQEGHATRRNHPIQRRREQAPRQDLIDRGRVAGGELYPRLPQLTV
jgi:hypothetical protein